jgi:hypothetical protein
MQYIMLLGTILDNAAGGDAMAWWVYKCNSKENPYKSPDEPPEEFDWRDFFDNLAAGGNVARWGLTSVIPALAQLQPEDMILAYQTDRNELVGLVRMVRVVGEEVHFQMVEEFGVRVRALKEANPRLAEIPAFSFGPKQTLLRISETDAQMVIDAARAGTP